jgi:hypothetical protein
MLEFIDLVVRNSFQFISYFNWWFCGAAIAHSIAVHGFSGYIGADGATYYWYDIVSWYKASKDGGMPSEF